MKKLYTQMLLYGEFKFLLFVSIYKKKTSRGKMYVVFYANG